MNVQVTYKCGHTGYIDIFRGSRKDWFLEVNKQRLCRDCERKEEEEENRRNKELAEQRGYVKLEGTEKQVAWAETLRMKFVERLNRDIESLEDSQKQYYCDMLSYILDNETSAVFYINSRLENAKKIVDEYGDKEKVNDVKKEDEEIQPDVIQESLMVPSYIWHDGIAEINIFDSVVTAKFTEINQTFIKIMHNLKYTWNSKLKRWERAITEYSGSATDRAAETANKLLLDGFKVLLWEDEARKKATDASYEPEVRHWLKFSDNKKKLFFNLDGYGDEYFEELKELEFTTWDSKARCFWVDLHEHNYAEDYANIKGFGVSKTAKAAIETYEKLKSNISRIKPKEQKIEKRDTLSDILRKPVEILEDLQDD